MEPVQDSTIEPPSSTDKLRVIYGAFFQAAEALDLHVKDLEKIVGLSPSTFSRMRGEAPSPIDNNKSYENLLLLLRLFRSLDSLVGGDKAKAQAWLKSDNKALGNTPFNLILNTEGLVRVVSYLDANRAKI